MFRTDVVVGQASVPIQLVLLPPVWNPIISDRVESLSLLGATVPVVSWQALILLKLYAAGPQDLLDVQHILAVRQPSEDERQALASRASTLGLTEVWQMVTER